MHEMTKRDHNDSFSQSGTSIVTFILIYVTHVVGALRITVVPAKSDSDVMFCLKRY